MSVSGECRHCKKPRNLESRGLCHTCYHKPWIRRSYAKIKKNTLPMVPCKHCARPTQNKASRGLCWRCRQNPVVRELYPAKVNQYRERARKAAKPTPPACEFAPGTVEKIELMRQRVVLEMPTCQPDDPPDAEQGKGRFLSQMDEKEYRELRESWRENGNLHVLQRHAHPPLCGPLVDLPSVCATRIS